ncbi:MAG TPA: HAD-IB family phosphatase [Anaerolineales bacterium]|nr:HAD-IB family phosphatase [Anaerolineales bacterium]
MSSKGYHTITQEKSIWKPYRKVVFDLDSTLVTIEGIDELARFKNKSREVIKLTRAAMEGELSYQEVFQQRLRMIRPAQSDLRTLGDLYLQNITTGAREVLAALRLLNIEVFIVTGSYEPAVIRLANYLDVLTENIYANQIFFNEHGDFLGYNQENPLCQDHGKGRILQQINGTPNELLLVGDGMTDYLTSSDTTGFVGFGGVVERRQVQQVAPIYIRCPDLSPVLLIAAGEEGCKRLAGTPYRNVLKRGADLMLRQGSVLFDARNQALRDEMSQFFSNGVHSN